MGCIFTVHDSTKNINNDNGQTRGTDRRVGSFGWRATGRRVGATSKSYLREDGTGDAEGDGRLGDLLGELLHVSASGRLDGGSVVKDGENEVVTSVTANETNDDDDDIGDDLPLRNRRDATTRREPTRRIDATNRNEN